MQGAAAEALRKHPSRQMQDMDRLGDLYRDRGLVFTPSSAAPLDPSNVRNRILRRLLRKAELPEIRFHDLRHTYATLLLSKKVHPKIVQERLGHANVAITLDTYSHVSPSIGDQAALAMENAPL